MPDPLIIVDSEARAQTLKSQLDGRVETWLVKTTPFQVSLLSDTGVGPDKFPLFSFSPAPGAGDLAAKLAASADRHIYLALDNDQRGNYWAWMIAEYLEQVSAAKNIAKRLICPGLIREEIERAMHAAEPVARRQGFTLLVRTLLNSAFAAQLKRLIGTESGPGNLPLTIPCLTTLFLVNDREQELASLKNRPAWRISARLESPAGEFIARLSRFVGVSEDGLVSDEAQARQVIALMRRDSFMVKAVRRNQFAIPAPEPYRLIALLHDAQLYFGISLARALAMVQSLYDGVTMPDGRLGLVSSYLPGPAVTPAWYALPLSGSGSFLFPLRPEISEDSLSDPIGADACLLYGLIRKRAMAGLMPQAQGEAVEVEMSTGSACFFQATDRRILEPGFLDTHAPPGQDVLAGTGPLTALEPGQKLTCHEVKPEPIERFHAESHTLDSLLVDLAEFSVIPDSATIAMLQQMLDNDYLRLDEHGHLTATARTVKVVATVNQAFPSMRNLNLTAYVEQLMQETLDGRKTLPATLNQFHQTINMHGRVLVKKTRPVSTPRPSREQLQARPSRPSRNIIKGGPASPRSLIAIEQPETAPPVLPPEPEARTVAENQDMAVQPGQDGKGRGKGIETSWPGLAEAAGVAAPRPPDLVAAAETCPSAPVEVDPEVFSATEAKTTVRNNNQEPGPAIGSTGPVPPAPEAGPARTGPETEARTVKPCPVCGRPLIVKQDQYGKFLTCSGFPSCRHSEAYQETSPGIMECPVCHGGSLVMKRTPAGKDLYVCPEPGCDFVAWSRPHGIACPLCRSPYLVEKLDNLGQTTLRCPRAGCGYIEPLTGVPADDLPTGPTDTAAPVRKKVLVRRATTGPGGAVRKVRVVKRK